MPMEEFEKELEQIDTNYPLSMPISLQLSVQIIMGLAFSGHYTNQDLALLQT